MEVPTLLLLLATGAEFFTYLRLNFKISARKIKATILECVCACNFECDFVIECGILYARG